MNRVAILIDGAFYNRRLPHLDAKVPSDDAEGIVKSIQALVARHLTRLAEEQKDTIYKQDTPNHEPVFVSQPDPYAQYFRTFYYDAIPLAKKVHAPISGKAQDLKKTREYEIRTELFERLRRSRGIALRLGEVKLNEPRWRLKQSAAEALKENTNRIDLTDDDFELNVRQKGVDMRMGLDIASIVFKKQANIIILVTGDADFVPAAKLARREGCRVILDKLHHGSQDANLHEHIDELHSVFRLKKK